MDKNRLLLLEAKVNAIMPILASTVADASKMKLEEVNGILAQRVADQVAILRQQEELESKKKV